MIYKNVYPNPRTWYDHYLYQSKSFLSGKVDIPDLPEYYQDKLNINGKILLPFPPMPAVVLIPALLLNPNITEQEISVIIGAINVVLVFVLLKKYTSEPNSLLISIFFAFGTVAFWSAIVGTTWYFAHNVAVTFLLLSLISFKNKWDFIAGIFFSMAVLSRYPVLLGGLFFLLELKHDWKRLLRFSLGAFLCVPAQLFYDYARFGHLLETGYVTIYKGYTSSNYPYTMAQLLKPGTPYFGYMDPRNIPLHLFTFFLYPPIIDQSLNVSPSPYGMGIVFTSPLLLIALRPYFKDIHQRNLFVAALAIALLDFMHYAQGWVQFGYRFILDFIPFLLIILAIRFRNNIKNMFLLSLSIFVSTWGAIWGIKLGW